MGRTYPVYFPGREPAGYWEMLRAKKPEPLIAPGARTDAEWIDAGRRVFEEIDVPAFRSTDPQLIAMARSLEEFAKRGGQAQKDGRVLGLRWVPTSKGLALGLSDCAAVTRASCPTARSCTARRSTIPSTACLASWSTRGTASSFPEIRRRMVNWRSFAVPGSPTTSTTA